MSVNGSGLITATISANGISIGDNSRKIRVFKITAGSNPYGAQELAILSTDGSQSNQLISFQSDSDQLWEISGRTDIAVNSVVIGYPNPFGKGWIFSAAETNPGNYSQVRVVTNVCVDASNLVTSVEYRTLTLPPGVVIGDRVCNTGVITDCCNGDPETQWYCISDECQEIAEGVDTTGMGTAYSSLANCQAACGDAAVVEVGCCVNPIKQTLTATISSKTGNCTCLPDSFNVVYDSINGYWRNTSLTDCSNTIVEVALRCFGGTTWEMDFFDTASPWSFSPADSSVCSPFAVSFNVDAGSLGMDVCSGTFTVTFTE